MNCLEVEQSVAELIGWCSLQRISNQECQLVCILTARWNPHSTWLKLSEKKCIVNHITVYVIEKSRDGLALADILRP